MSNANVEPSATPTSPKSRLSKRLFLGFLAAVSVGYAVVLSYHLLVPVTERTEANDSPAFLEICRQVCLRNGLVPTGHLANDAKAYLRSEKPLPLFEPLHELLSDGRFVPQESQPHPLLGKVAPEFELPDDQGRPVSLKQLLEEGPVVLVFYYGYHCNHCVGQLFGLNEDLPRFTELGTSVVAVSGDPSKLTASRFAEYGRFGFPVLSDEGHRLAQTYGVFEPATATKPENQLHGTFVIDSDGTVLWCHSGNKPYLENRTLLSVIAHKYGLVAPPSSAKASDKN